MAAATVNLRNAPIVEAVLDVDCDLRPGFNLAGVEAQAVERFRDRYPKVRKQFLQELKIEGDAEALSGLSARRAVQALQFLQDDEKQLVQVRTQGFSFNRLAPYSTLDDYLPEIERTWRMYVELAKPVETRLVRLRYINRILLPLVAGKVDLDDYLTRGPRLADENIMNVTGFLVQYSALERDSDHQINVVVTAQAPENETLPVILDIGVAKPLREEPDSWPAIRKSADSLRGLKNKIFLNSLTDKCLQLFN